MYLAFCYKPNGINPAYISPIIWYLDDSETEKVAGHVMFLAQLRDPNGANVPLQTPSATEKLYSMDDIVMSIDDPNYSYFSAIGDLVIMLNDVACNSVVRPIWQYQVPSFVNRGRATPPTIVPLSTYLLNEDYISFIKRFWENCES